MAEERHMSRQAFSTVATAAGIDAAGAHGEDLFHFVQAVLAGFESLKDIDVAGAEPDMAFFPTGPGGNASA